MSKNVPDFNVKRQESGSCNEFTDKAKDSLTSIVEKNKDNIVLYVSNFDSVRNTDNFSDSPLYGTDYAKLSYDEKLVEARNRFEKRPCRVNRNNWTRQQWAPNVIRYAQITKKHLVYIQSDLWYACYPSTLAEAVEKNLFDNGRFYENFGFHFSGQQIDLFCVGNMSIATKMINFLQKSTNFQYFERQEFEWWPMTDQFIRDFYGRKAQNFAVQISVPEWMRLPDSFWENFQKEPKSYSGKLVFLSKTAQDFTNIKTFDDLIKQTALGNQMYRFIVNGKRYDADMPGVPISYLLDDSIPTTDLQIACVLKLDVDPTASFVDHKCTFDGTAEQPVIILRDGVTVLNKNDISMALKRK